MKTHKVRPVLVETKSTNNPNNIHIESNGKMVLVHGSYIEKQYEPILISLENEEIEDRILRLLTFETFDGLIETIITDKKNFSGNYKTISEYKVIARQSKISPEYISKFVEQYNNDCVEDLEIEMEEIKSVGDEFGYKTGDLIFPKLTNGFVTIVEKELIYFPIEVKKDSIILYGAGKFHEERLILNRDQAALLFVELYKFLEFDKEITYTEEEVIKYCLEALNMGFDLNNRPSPRLNGKTGTQYFMEWFNENKK